VALRRRSAGRRIAGRAAIGVLLLAALLCYADISVHQPALAAPAASCVTHHTNVQAYDSGGNDSFGEQANIYVNTYATLSTLQDAIARTILIWNDAQTSNVEFGWNDDNLGYDVPIVISDYEVQGTTQAPSAWPSYPLSYNTSVNFRIENVGDRGIFRYVVGNEGSPIAYSPTMGFNEGWPVTNSEHYNNCDTLWTDMSGLEDQISVAPESWESYVSLNCWADTSVNDWYLHEVSSDEIQVNANSSGGEVTWGEYCDEVG
jgi:hypothetical protein